MRGFLEVVTTLGAIFGVLLLVFAFTAATGAPQEGAAAALAVAVTVIPYCLAAMAARLEMSERQKKSEALLEELLGQIRAMREDGFRRK